jgi:hypothetical protein|tara:strand:+ start:417 stop:647 length:231 start_codon:yes stop_codon:yes gene_type:complete
MKLKEVLAIQKILGNKIPVDMADKYVYYSDSRDEWVDIMELDVIHAIRILRKYVGQDEDYLKELKAFQEQNLQEIT